MNPANQPEPSLRKQVMNSLWVSNTPSIKKFHTAITIDQLDKIMALFQADKEAAVREARTNELNMFMDVNAQTVTDTQGSYIARRYQTLASTEFTRPQAGEGEGK